MLRQLCSGWGWMSTRLLLEALEHLWVGVSAATWDLGEVLELAPDSTLPDPLTREPLT
jgi:hypothetical protein